MHISLGLYPLYPMGGPFAEGKLEGYVVQCPWQGSRYDVRSSEVVRPPAMRPEPLYSKLKWKIMIY